MHLITKNSNYEHVNPIGEKIQTLRPDGRAGAIMLRNRYDVLCSFILDALYTNKDLTLHQLIEKVCKNMNNPHTIDLPWLILQVKLDLEAQGLIKPFVPMGQLRLLHLKLTKLGLLIMKSTISIIVDTKLPIVN